MVGSGGPGRLVGSGHVQRHDSQYTTYIPISLLDKYAVELPQTSLERHAIQIPAHTLDVHNNGERLPVVHWRQASQSMSQLDDVRHPILLPWQQPSRVITPHHPPSRASNGSASRASNPPSQASHQPAGGTSWHVPKSADHAGRHTYVVVHRPTPPRHTPPSTNDMIRLEKERQEDEQIFVRRYRKQPAPEPPVYRMGRAGSVWRHMKSCINSEGNHMIWVDGTVRQEENIFYPPNKRPVSPDTMYITASRPTQRPKTSNGLYNYSIEPIHYTNPNEIQLKRKPVKINCNNVYQQHAKNGFKYWYHENRTSDYSSKYAFGGGTRWLGLPSGDSLAGRPPAVLLY